MKTTNHRRNLLTAFALLLALPTAYFITISLLKYEFNVDGPFDSATPFLERLGFKENIGWNINLLILFGPMIAFLLAMFQVFKANWQFSKEQFEFHFTFRKKWFPLMVAVISGGLLLTLFIYMVGENS